MDEQHLPGKGPRSHPLKLAGSWTQALLPKSRSALSRKSERGTRLTLPSIPGIQLLMIGVLAGMAGLVVAARPGGRAAKINIPAP